MLDTSKMISLNPVGGHVDGRKYVGYWRSSSQSLLPLDPRNFVGAISGDRAEIAERLAVGGDFIQWMGRASCRICGAQLGSRCLTFDGSWVWPEKLEHYVLEHNLVLPQEFIDHLMGIPEGLLQELQNYHSAKEAILQEKRECPDQRESCGSTGSPDGVCSLKRGLGSFFYGRLCGLLEEQKMEALSVLRGEHQRNLKGFMQIPWKMYP
jgi:hypothetical protein